MSRAERDRALRRAGRAADRARRPPVPWFACVSQPLNSTAAMLGPLSWRRMRAAACMSGVMPPRRALPPRHRLLADEVLLLQRRFEPAVQRLVGAIQHRQPLEIRVVDRAELRRRPRLHVERAGHRARHAGRNRDARRACRASPGAAGSASHPTTRPAGRCRSREWPGRRSGCACDTGSPSRAARPARWSATARGAARGRARGRRCR